MDDWLVSVVSGGKVVDLYFSDNLVDIDTIKALHRGCDIETMRVGYAVNKAVKTDQKNVQRLSRAVRCIETGDIYPSVKYCSNETGIGVKSIYESIRRGIAAKGLNFEYVKD